MERIYDDAIDKNVSTVIVYMNAEGNLFYDADNEVEVKAEECLNLFFKGVVAFYDGVYYKPLSCTEEGVITFANTSESDVTG